MSANLVLSPGPIAGPKVELLLGSWFGWLSLARQPGNVTQRGGTRTDYCAKIGLASLQKQIVHPSPHNGGCEMSKPGWKP
jgi:hypothetical protein